MTKSLEERQAITCKAIAFKEYVSLIIGLYKNNGSVSHVAIGLLLIYPLYPAITQAVLIRFA